MGTHALLAERVAFARLGMVVIDEQHRFGVAQRALLREKGGLLHQGEKLAPHLLVMTATPIPRTLALTIYGDLDVTKLDELPLWEREPPETKVMHGATARTRALAALRAALDEKRQAYWVCPLVEESKKSISPTSPKKRRPGCAASSTDSRRPRAWTVADPGARPGDARLSQRRAVGARRHHRHRGRRVDVPTASLMIIEGAERFGLAQLHQLRGRIGRGGGRSTCLLLSGSRAGDAGDRLGVMAETSDGFKVAEADLRIRQAGDLFGTRQAGLPRLRHADLVRDFPILEEAREDAFALLEQDPELAAHPTKPATSSKLAGPRRACSAKKPAENQPTGYTRSDFGRFCSRSQVLRFRLLKGKRS